MKKILLGFILVGLLQADKYRDKDCIIILRTAISELNKSYEVKTPQSRSAYANRAIASMMAYHVCMDNNEDMCDAKGVKAELRKVK